MSTLGISLEYGMFLSKKEKFFYVKTLNWNPTISYRMTYHINMVDNIDEEHKKECRDLAEWLMIDDKYLTAIVTCCKFSFSNLF